MKNTVYLRGMKIDNINKVLLFDELEKQIKKKSTNYISITNTEAMFIGSKDNKHFSYINNSYLSLCDGTGLVIAGKFNGLKISKYHGPDFFEDILNVGQEFGWTHYFLGGKLGVAEKLINNFIKKFPNVKIIGNYSPPFRKLTQEEETAMIDNINKLKPNFVWVSLGLPKQERWISKYINRLNTNFMVGVGAAFDFHTDSVKRAPIFYQKIGMEWLYRTIFERRLVKRQIRGFRFMFGAILNKKSKS